MALSHIHLWRCFFGTVPPKPPGKILHFFSKLRFDGEGEISASKHDFNFWKFCGSHNITHRNIICRLFTLTFVGQVKSWRETLSATSIHTWEQFLCESLHAFENFDYDESCAEMSELRKNIDESLEVFVIIFSHLCYRFPLEDRTSNNDLISCLVFLASKTYKSVDE